MIGKLNHVAIAVPDLDAATAVYRDTLGATVTEPDTLQSRVEEADFTEAFPGVEPYPCEVAP